MNAWDINISLNSILSKETIVFLNFGYGDEKIWNRIKVILLPEHQKAGKTGKRGRPAKYNNYRMMNDILWIARNGALWREVPECYGQWQAVYVRFRLWKGRKYSRRSLPHEVLMPIWKTFLLTPLPARYARVPTATPRSGHLIEYFLRKIKWFHRILSRYDKLDASFFVLAAAIAVPLKQ